MLATAAARPPVGPGYAFEFKWDGMRALAFCKPDGSLRLVSRNGNDVSIAFPELAAMPAALSRAAVLDGEIVAMDAKGRPDFGLLQSRLGIADAAEARRLAAASPAHYIAFDVLELDGTSLVSSSLLERRKSLDALHLDGPSWSVSPQRIDDGPAMLEASRRLGMEGIVAKRLSSQYAAGRRSDAWLKIRNRMRQEFVVGGWSQGEGSRRGSFGALLVGHYATPPRGRSPGRLVYAGRVGSGFRGPELQRLRHSLQALSRAASPFAGAAGDEEGDVHWVDPVLVAEVEFSGLTQHGVLRQPTFKGLRTDKPARQVVWEQAEVTPWPVQSGADPSVLVL